METNKMVSFLNKAMELSDSMMQFSGCELASNNMRTLLEGLRAAIITVGGKSPSLTCADIIHNIDILLEEEGIAQAEADAYMDDVYEDSDEYYEDCLYNDDSFIDPMDSAEDAFAYIEEQDYLSYLNDINGLEFEEYSEKDYEAEEINEYANQDHPDVNVELKQTLEEVKNDKINAAIWAAREHMMSKIVFDNDDAYPIHRIDFDLDDNGIPVDIVISTREKYLNYIAANHCQLGYSLNDEEEHGFKTALYGRLDSFRLYNYKGEPISWDSLPSALYRAVSKVMQSKLSQEVIEDTFLGIVNRGTTSISDIVQLLMENLEDWDK